LGPAPVIYSYYCLLRQHANTRRHLFYSVNSNAVCATTKILFCSEVPATDTLNFWQEEHRTILQPSRLDKEGFIIGILAVLSMFLNK
jgi:hypothetical protein